MGNDETSVREEFDALAVKLLESKVSFDDYPNGVSSKEEAASALGGLLAKRGIGGNTEEEAAKRGLKQIESELGL